MRFPALALASAIQSPNKLWWMLPFKIKGHEKAITSMKVMPLWVSHQWQPCGHWKSKTWDFEKVNTRWQRNQVMSIVESKESLQKAWEWLQCQCLETTNSETKFLFGKNWFSMRQTNPFYRFSIFSIWQLKVQICLSMRQFPGVAWEALLQRSWLDWGRRWCYTGTNAGGLRACASDTPPAGLDTHFR